MSTNPSLAAAAHHAPAARPFSNARALAPWYLIEFMNSYAATLLTAGCFDYACSHKGLNLAASRGLLLSSAWGFAYIFIALGAGRLSEKFGPRRVVGLMVLLSVLSSLLGLLAIALPNLWVLLAIMVPFNITSSTIWPAIESAITRSPASTRLSTRTAFYNLSWGSAGFVAFFTCGTLENWSWATVFIAPAIVSALSLVIFAKYAIPAAMISAANVPEEAAGEHELDDPAMKRRAHTLLKMAWVGNALAYVVINALIAIKTPLAVAAAITSLPVAAFVTSIWSLTRFAGFAITWKWAGWHYKIRWLLGAEIALAASFALMLCFNNLPMLIAMQILFGFAAALIYSSSLYYAMHVSEGHGGHAGIHEALIGLGICIGPGIGALAGIGQRGETALTRIAIGISAVMLLGILAMAYTASTGIKEKNSQHANA